MLEEFLIPGEMSQAAFAENAAAGIIVLLCLLLIMNATAIVLRDRFQRRAR